MRILTAIVFSLFICTQAAQAATLEERKLEATSYMEVADYEAAYAVYAALLWDYPDDDEVNLGIALSARHIDRIYPALMALERLSVKYPRDMQIRRELLIIYLQVNDTESARREAEILQQNDIDLAGINTSGLASSVSFLYSGRLAFGVGYDSNANAGLSSNEILPGLFLQDAEKVDSPNAFVQATLNGSYNINPSWWLVGDLNAYYRYNTASELVNNTDILWLRAAFGGRYATSRYMLDMRLKADLTQQGSDVDDQEIFAHGLDASLTYAVTRRIMVTTHLSADARDYNQSEKREGLYWSAGEALRFIINKSSELNLGLRMLGSSTDAPMYDYIGWEANARMLFYLAKFEISPFYAYRQDGYDDKPSFLDLEDREDKQWRAGASLLWRFYGDWSVDLTYQYTNNNSNSVLYDYEQHTVNLSAAVLF